MAFYTPYKYRELQGKNQIRLLTLLPGQPEDDIRVAIKHAYIDLVHRKDTKISRSEPGLAEINDDLDGYGRGWIADKTIDGRVIFVDVRTKGRMFTTWEHPYSRSRFAHLKRGRLPSLHRRLSASPSRAIRALKPSRRAPRYEAVSYAWGLTQDPVRITVSSHNGIKDRSLEIQPSLFEALRGLRLPTKRRTLWIDAICIDQDNIKEKTVHIPNMCWIYTHATQTIIWLGGKSDDSDIAMESLINLASQVVLFQGGGTGPSPDAQDAMLYKNPRLSSAAWNAVCNLLSRRYFDRLWVISEIAMARWRAKVICGRHEMSLVDLRTAVNCLMNNSDTLPGNAFGVLMNVETMTYPLSRLSFGNILSVYRQYVCSKPEDMVYGLLSLASSEFRNKITVDSELPAKKVYRDTVLALEDHYHRVDFLQDCRLDLKMPSAPSWVPNLTKHYGYLSPYGFCSGLSRSHIEVNNSDSIEILGVRCCTITSIGSVFDSKADPMPQLRTWYNILRDSTPLLQEQMDDLFVRTIFLDRTKERNPDPGPESLARLKEMLLPGLKSDDLNSHDENLLAQLRGILNGRDLIRTSDGHFGLGPGVSQPGDIVVAFLGSLNLISLRPRDSAFEVVGNCFVLKYHDARAFLGPLEESCKVVLPGDDHGGIRAQYRCSSRTVGNGSRRDENDGNEKADIGDGESDADEQDIVHDPRLDPLPEQWRWIETERTNNDPFIFETFKNTVTGERMNSDPRMLPDALRARGVELEYFKLI